MSLLLLAVNLSASDFNIILNFIVNNNPEVQQKFNLLRSLDVDVGYGSERDSSLGGFYFGTTVDIKEYWDFKEKLRDKEKQTRLEVIDLIDGLIIAKADALLLKMQKNYFNWKEKRVEEGIDYRKDLMKERLQNYHKKPVIYYVEALCTYVTPDKQEQLRQMLNNLKVNEYGEIINDVD